jgi:anti-sigma B factor antagonist
MSRPGKCRAPTEVNFGGLVLATNCGIDRSYIGLEEHFVDLTLATHKEGDSTVVVVGGEIDVYTAPKLREQLIDLVGAGAYNLIVDMEGVEFLDSTGLGVLVGGLKRVRAHDGTLKLVCTQERILKIFRITGLTKVFPIFASVTDAAASES